MKTTSARLMIKPILIIGTVCVLSLAITDEGATVIALLIAWYIIRFLIRSALYTLIMLIKWICIITVLGLLFYSLF